MPLHACPNPEGVVSYCGPSALASLMGCTVTEADNAVLAYRGDKGGKPMGVRGRVRGLSDRAARVTTMWSSEIEGVVGRLGAVATELDLHAQFGRKPTLAAFLRFQKRRYHAAKLLVLFTGHFIAVEGNEWCDSGKRVPQPFSASKSMRKRVRHVWIITQ